MALLMASRLGLGLGLRAGGTVRIRVGVRVGGTVRESDHSKGSEKHSCDKGHRATFNKGLRAICNKGLRATCFAQLSDING